MMIRNALIALVAAALVLGALGFLNRETVFLHLAERRVESSTLDARMALLRSSVEIATPEGEGPFPVVLQFHGCAGPRWPMEREWAAFFNEQGYAAMIVDSTGPRGFDREDALREVCGARTLMGRERAGDVLAALRIARADARLDMDRVILAGWSHGAWTVMDWLGLRSADMAPWGLEESARASERPVGAILFYPYCGPGVLSRKQTWSDAPPALALLAEGDSIVDTDQCVRVIDRLTQAGAPIEKVVYPGVDHAFDDHYHEPEWMFLHDEDAAADARDRIADFLERL